MSLSDISISLTDLLLGVGVAAVILTLIVVFLFKKHKNIFMSYVQNFCGALFIFSGFVKAIDPLGTAYKNQDYFKEFETTLEATWFSFIAPMFPFLSQYAVATAVFVIVLEIVVGIMLLIGFNGKATSRIFLGIIAFFTALTGYTYLTGYVPQGVNFFQFGQWGPYVESNMKVTDCGCFGDFIKLKPFVSFMKDVFLLIPAFYFLFRSKDMHELFTPFARKVIIVVSSIALLYYSLGNFVWDIPETDFRPFKEGKNIAEQRQAELDAMASVQITGWKLENIKSGKVVELSNAVYMKEFKNYPKTDWKVIDQIKTEPAIKATKLSEMEFTHPEGYDFTDDILQSEEPIYLVIAYKMYADARTETNIVQDSLFIIDTLISEEDDEKMLVKQFDKMVEKQVKTTVFDWDKDYLADYNKVVTPLAKEAAKDSIKTYIIAGGAGLDMLEDLEKNIGSGAAFLTADDILLKTIVRSNPGIVLIENGEIKGKWHKKKFPGHKAVFN